MHTDRTPQVRLIEMRGAIEDMLGDNLAAARVIMRVQNCLRNDAQETRVFHGVERTLTTEIKKYINSLITLGQVEPREEEAYSGLESILRDVVQCKFPGVLISLLNKRDEIDIGILFIALAKAEADDPILQLHDRLINKTVKSFELLVGREGIARSVVADESRIFLTTLLRHLSALRKIENAAAPDRLTALVRKIAWEYIGQNANKDVLGRAKLAPYPRVGMRVNTMEIGAFLLSALDFRERQIVLLSRFSGVSKRDIARHLAINIEELDAGAERAFGKMRKHAEGAPWWQSGQQETKTSLSEQEFEEKYKEIWQYQVWTLASIMLTHTEFADSVTKNVLIRAKNLLASGEFDTDAAWVGTDECPGFRRLTFEETFTFVKDVDRIPDCSETRPLWHKCIQALTDVDEFRFFILATFFLPRETIASNLRLAPSPVDEKIQSALRKIVEKLRENRSNN